MSFMVINIGKKAFRIYNSKSSKKFSLVAAYRQENRAFGLNERGEVLILNQPFKSGVAIDHRTWLNKGFTAILVNALFAFKKITKEERDYFIKRRSEIFDLEMKAYDAGRYIKEAEKLGIKLNKTQLAKLQKHIDAYEHAKRPWDLKQIDLEEF